ncbi:phage minor capsid protein [Blautia producta]|uniref:phage minor capsid protein n=1 Tax=Blautia producta TaxID=33035 RepID=UPI001D05938D|nr:phage minor capsid protein [Blautia producta]MCB5878421.1 phage minor capsid protein [Blautia producta]
MAADIPTGTFQDLEEQLMANIIRHCKDYDQPIATDEWLMKKLAEIGKLNRENIKIIAKSTGLSQTAMERMLNEMADRVLEEVEPGMRQLVRRGLVGEAVPAKKSKNVKQVLTTMHGQAKDVLNLCNTTMLYKARDAYKKLVSNIATAADEIADKQQKIDILNKHTISAVIGAESRQQALVKCIREFNEKGIPAFVDKRGREWTPEAYVNMAMRSTSNTMAAEVQMARADDYGLDLVEVDSHSGARPKCARDQGKIFDRANKSKKYPHWNTSSYGEPDGLLGINCGHHIFPYMEGVSIRRYFPTEDMDANDKLYKETQVQRALERDVRKQKRECMLYDELGNKEAFEQAAVKLKEKEAKLKSYVNGNSQLHRRADREQVVGFDKRISSRVVAENKNYIAKYSKRKYNEDGSVAVTDDWKDKEHVSIPKKYRPNAVIESKETKSGGTQVNRTFYDGAGLMEHQIHTGPHGNAKRHPYGKVGEHRHEYIWNEDGSPKSRKTTELTETDRKENNDIL